MHLHARLVRRLVFGMNSREPCWQMADMPGMDDWVKTWPFVSAGACVC